jgi:histidinol-phosphatase
VTGPGSDRLDALLRLAHELADLADDVTRPAFERYRDPAREGPVDRKDDGSPVTQADLEAERVIRRALRRRAPDHAFLGEEDGLDGAEDAPTWVVDPIDGTKNFVRGIPVFATLIALTDGDVGLVGVISAPALGHRWDGIRGGPAREDGRPIRVSETTDLHDAHVSFGGLNHFAGVGSGIIDRFTGRTARQRGFGEFWQHCLVARGAVDIAMEGMVNRWDLAAPKVVVEAAGGRLTSLSGEHTDDGGSALTTNGHLHHTALELVHGGSD